MEIAEYKNGDESHICDLFKVVFKRDLDIKYWFWRYDQNPFMSSKLIKLMWDNDKLIGHYALSPMILNYGSVELLAALSMTTMVHPEYEGLGILSKLTNSAYEQYAKALSLKMIYGFPNKHSHYSLVKFLNWKDIERIPTLSLEIINYKSTGIANLIKVKQEFDNHKVYYHKNADGLHLKKDYNYLNWRYNKNPANDYSIFEIQYDGTFFYAVTKVFKSFTENSKYEIDILELEFPPHYGNVKNLVAAILDHYSSYQLLKINCWQNLQSPMHHVLDRIGFVCREPVTYFGMRVLDEKLDLNNWQYSMGFSDIY